MSTEAKHILIVDDDPDIGALLEMNLQMNGFSFERATDGKSGLERALAGTFSLVLLDLTMPHMDGLDVCKQLHQAKPELPIMIVSSRSDEVDKVLGFELGADDFVLKPFSPRELMSRVKAILRRSELAAAPSAAAGSAASAPAIAKISIGQITLNLDSREVFVSEKPLAVTATEYDLLYLLASNPGRVFEREQLLEIVWGYRAEGYARNVDCHVSRLRNKIEADPANPLYLRTVYGIGYRFCRPDELSA